MSHTAHPDRHAPSTGRTTAPTTRQRHEDSGPKKSWALLAVALAAQILVVLDISVVNTALPTIGSALHLDGSQLAVAGHRLPDDVRRRPAPGRPHRRPALAPPGVPDRADPVHRRLPGQRVRRQRQPAHRGPRRPGTQRRAAHPLRAVADHDHLRRRPAQDRAGHVGCRRQPRRRRRCPARRRLTTWASWQAIFWINGPIGARRPARRTPHHRQGHRRPDPASATSTCPAPRRHRRPRHPHLRARRHRHARLVVRPHRRPRSAVSAVLLGAFLKLEQRADQAAVPAAHLEAHTPWSPAPR